MNTNKILINVKKTNPTSTVDVEVFYILYNIL